jgi:hypothetical protein
VLKKLAIRQALESLARAADVPMPVGFSRAQPAGCRISGVLDAFHPIWDVITVQAPS